MSVQATTWVWEQSQAEGNARLVLLAIADGANREGKNSWQSASTIAKMCRISPRTVQRKIEELVLIGELSKDGVRGEKHANVYSLPGVLEPAKKGEEESSRYDNGDKPLRQNDTAATTRLSYNPINPNISKDIYPIRDAREQKPETTKGTRLTENFFPEQKHIDKIRKLKPGINLDIEHTKFINYWISATGKNATKRDWGRTWENWMLNAKEQTTQPWNMSYTDKVQAMMAPLQNQNQIGA